jgi:uncharacterized protein with beta-barrel porin domain
MMSPSALRRRALLSGTVLVAAATSYGRRSYAACVPSGGGSTTYQCSGANFTTQTINANNATVTTDPGFSVTAPSGNAITITGDGAQSYTDTNAAQLSAPSEALYVRSGGDFAGTPGSVTISTNGALSGGQRGIQALNLGTGALTITANGNVTGALFGINARSFGGNLSVTTGTDTTVSGGLSGIRAATYGTGAATITVNGDVNGGVSGSGIYAISASINVTTGAGTTVSGGLQGFRARNDADGGTTITANGTVTGPTGMFFFSGGATVTVGGAGVVTGSGGTAIRFANAANRLDLVTGAVINGTVLGSLATDTLGLSGTGSGSLNVGQLSAFEAGQKTGAGTWTLTGANAGISTFAVSGGTLAVNGSLSNAAFTVSGGTLGGIGTVGNTSVAGGSFRPGSGTPGSSMNVNGTLGFNSASTYIVDINPTASSFANVSGAATLGNAGVNAIFAPGSYVARRYTILTAGSISGTFGTLTNTNLPANFRADLSYDATNAYLTLGLRFMTPAGGNLNGNQNNVANALADYFDTNGGIPFVFSSLNANGLSQVSGQPGASTAQTGITGMGQFINAVFDSAFDENSRPGATSFAPGDDDEAASAYASKKNVARDAKEAFAAVTPRDLRASPFASRWNVWASAYGGDSRVNGDASAGTNTTTSRIFGTAVGASYRLTPDTQFGFAMGGAGSSFSLDGGFGGGKADIFNAAVYAKHNAGSAYLAGLVGYSWQDTTTDRTLTVAGTDQLHAQFKAQALVARLESGWRFATPIIGVTPYAAMQTMAFYLPGYGETASSGSTTFALNYASQTVHATRGELGARFDKAMLVDGGVFTLKAKAAWAHDWNTERAARATFQTLPGATFTVNGAQPSDNAGLASIGADMKWHNGWTLAGSFDGEFSGTTASYAGKGSVRYAW